MVERARSRAYEAFLFCATLVECSVKKFWAKREEESMRKAIIAFFVVSFLAATERWASAGVLVEICWSKGLLSTVETSLSAGGSQLELHGVQTTTFFVPRPGPNPGIDMITRRLLFTGNATVVGSQILMGLMHVHDGSGFGGCRALSESVTLNLATFEGTGTIVGVGCDFGPSTTAWTIAPCP